MKNKIFIVIIVISFSVYLLTSTMNYSLDYKTQELEDDIDKLNQEIDEQLIDERINLAREEAEKEYGLKLNNNWYYLKDIDE